MADALYQGENAMNAPREAVMTGNVNFVHLISSAVGWSLGISVAAATAILGVAALLQ